MMQLKGIKMFIVLKFAVYQTSTITAIAMVSVVDTPLVTFPYFHVFIPFNTGKGMIPKILLL